MTGVSSTGRHPLDTRARVEAAAVGAGSFGVGALAAGAAVRNVSPLTGSSLLANLKPGLKYALPAAAVGGALAWFASSQLTAPDEPASLRTRLLAAVPGGALLGSGALALHMWNRQMAVSGKAVIHAADPLHVRIAPSVPIALAAGVVGTILLADAYRNVSQERTEAIRDAGIAGYVGVGLAATVGFRIADRGGIFRNPASTNAAKLYELVGYGMNYATVGAIAGTAGAVAFPGAVNDIGDAARSSLD
jgi:hypothetical protein